MNKLDLLRIVWTNLLRMKVRTALTTFGVVIGTSAIVTMISIGAGMKKNITEQLGNMGSATELRVMPKYEITSSDQSFDQMEPVEPLDDKAIKKIIKLPYVKDVTPDLSVYGIELKVGRYSSKVIIKGVEPSYSQKVMQIYKGRSFRQGDKNVVIVGYKLGQALQEETKGTENGKKLGKKKEKKVSDFPIQNSVNEQQEKIDLYRKSLILKAVKTDKDGQTEEKTIRVNVVGVLVETGQQEDVSVFVPLGMAKNLKMWKEGRQGEKMSYELVKVQIDSPQNIEQAQKEIEGLGFSIFSLKQMLGTVNKIFGIIEVFLGGIGSISLFVASFGIINTMIMSIYERTREIGIMKVVGATVKDIKMIFLFEAGTIGFLGGIIGLGFGWTASKIINVLANLYLRKGATETIELVYVPLWLAIFSLGFSTLVGLLAGLYPAVRAAKLSPLEAIRQL
ncbi:ABC transporter permease [Carboxydocella sp. ULO1]|uniref:ABC transporter permease n=1 Tax=Carboxydocella sp. ULO1 TaxID=1926599 RepID=UPI0009ACF73A|nr:ABC transporter permease [Carboxydocella sp. ULO1]